VFLDGSLTLDLKSGLPFPYTWNERYRAKIGVLPRDRTRRTVQWIDVPPYYAFHLANSYEDADGRIVVEGTHYDRAAWEYASKWINSQADHGPWMTNRSRWARWTIDPRNATANVDVRDELAIEFPTVNASKLGRHTRYSYAVAFPTGALKTTGIVKYDGQTGRRELLELAPGQMPSEPFFVADPTASSEDAGWLFSYVNDLRTHRSELWIIDASAMRSPPVAAIEIPGWVPAGVHGSWISDAELERRS
jgi:carotenoid cleavage dioxygenase